MLCFLFLYSFFYPFLFLHHPPTTATPTLSLHDALPTSRPPRAPHRPPTARPPRATHRPPTARPVLEHPWRIRTSVRSEEHTSELQSRGHLVCRLLLVKKNHNFILSI